MKNGRGAGRSADLSTPMAGCCMAGFHWLNTEQWQQVAVVQKLKWVSCHFKDCLLQSTGPQVSTGQILNHKPPLKRQVSRSSSECRGPEEGATAGER